MIKFRQKEFVSNKMKLAVKGKRLIQGVRSCNPTRTEGAAKLAEVVVGKPFTVIGSVSPVPGGTGLGMVVDKGLNKITGGGLDKAGKAAGKSVIESAPYRRYVGVGGHAMVH